MVANLQPTIYDLRPRIIFWGTMDVAVPTLEALLKNGYKVVAVVSTPDQPAGRKQILTPTPVKAFAQKHKIPVFQPENLKDENFKKELPEADLYVLVAYGKIIPKSILERPRLGILNGHPSLLPRWRGPSPIQSTILNGDTEAGVTIFLTDELMDHGPILLQRKLQITNDKLQKMTNPELHKMLAELRVELFMEVIPKWLKDEITPIPQDDAKTTYCKILKKDDGRIDWKKPAEHIERMVRAFNPWPGTWTLWPSDQKIYRIRIEEASVVDETHPHGSPGYIWQSESHPFLVKTGHNSISVTKLTLAGKKTLAAETFLRGYPQIIGTTLV
ncbi:MAG: methionyl-tRNA formyltransferase [Candidatus Sungbacteria bacterium]|nr:methionyl-tRNA formyltransferase [Candidatus Sungbacteria bacterium]